MKRNDWHMKPGEFHLTVLGVIARPDGTFPCHKRKPSSKALGTGLVEVSGGAAQAGERVPWRPCAVRSERKPDPMRARLTGGYLLYLPAHQPG